MDEWQKYLLLEARKKNKWAIEKLLKIYEPLCRMMACKYKIYGNAWEDNLQITKLALVEAIEDFRLDKSPKGWDGFVFFAEMVIFRRLQEALDVSMREKNRILNSALSLNNSIVPDGDCTLEDFVPDTADVEEKALHALGYNHNEKILSNLRLTPLEHKVFPLFLEGCTYAVIAKEAGCKDDKSVDNALQRIRKKIKCTPLVT